MNFRGEHGSKLCGCVSGKIAGWRRHVSYCGLLALFGALGVKIGFDHDALVNRRSGLYAAITRLLIG